MTKDELRECLARAISGSPFPSRRSLARADAALAALRDAGFAIVPKEPSEAMVEAHIESCAGQCDEAGPESVRAAWEAMLSAGDLLGERGS
jgi:hypothetical protein